MSEYLILVDEDDNEKGKEEKLAVHRQGLLHRAFSVFIFDTKGRLLLQQRAGGKYHSAGLWSNTVCSHPHYGEETATAVKRRMQEEMGLQCPVDFAFRFVYKAKFDNGLTEYESDHVYIGISDDTPRPGKEEVQNWEYIHPDTLTKEIMERPQHYTEWLKICLPRVLEYFNSLKSK